MESRDKVPAYLVLLRVGFTMPQPLLDARCALTAPFHPYLPVACATGLAVCSLLHWPSGWLEPSVPDVIRHTALRSSDFPPPLNTLRHERQRSSSRLLFLFYSAGEVIFAFKILASAATFEEFCRSPEEKILRPSMITIHPYN